MVSSAVCDCGSSGAIFKYRSHQHFSIKVIDVNVLLGVATYIHTYIHVTGPSPSPAPHRSLGLGLLGMVRTRSRSTTHVHARQAARCARGCTERRTRDHSRRITHVCDERSCADTRQRAHTAEVPVFSHDHVPSCRMLSLWRRSTSHGHVRVERSSR